MFQKLPSFQAITAFHAVARHRNFSKAAEELCVTQSAVSHRIKVLEQQFETKLFVRSPTVRLTSEGAFFLGAVTDALTMLEAACASLAKSRRVVKLSTGPAFARSWLVKHLSDFYSRHNDIDVEINATKSAYACVKSGEADVAICYGKASDWEGFQHTEIVRSEVFPVCSPEYSRCFDPGDVPAALTARTLLRTPRQPWKPWFQAAGLKAEEPDHGPLFSDAALMLDAAAHGQGIALARNILVEQDLSAKRLIRVSDIGIQSEFAYCAIYGQQTAQREGVAVFLDWLTASSRDALRVEGGGEPTLSGAP